MSTLRSIPSIEQLRQRPAIRLLEARYGGEATVEALRAGASKMREALSGAGGSQPDEDVAREIERMTAVHLEQAFRPSLQRVINATGVIVHTNLGRAPLSDAAIARVAEVARGYSTLEYDLVGGKRGRRDVHAESMLCRLTGAEAATVVNNNAAATMLILAAVATGREVIVSRGELVEIGGGFRVPDVMAQSGALLREVGTTNKTRAADYAAAITERTALLLRVHPSNFVMHGFTERPELADLVAVGKKFNVPVAEDLGSGDLRPSGVQSSIAAGVDLCCFSGDKLLGGPQAGIIVGRTALVDRVRSYPLMRALRVDKMTYAALDATLAEYAAGRAAMTVPVQRMLSMTADEVLERATRLKTDLTTIGGWVAELVRGGSAVGGGSAPGVELPTWLVALENRGLSASALEERLRASTPPIIARVEQGRVLLDLRTVLPAEDGQLALLLKTV
jgi:L-seryl-tRNA(Ser) seleniumtransferase